jgi:hypothetical protein
MNEKGDIYSSIEQLLLYKTAYVTFSPGSILKAAVAKTILYTSFPRFFGILTIKTGL